MGGRGPSYGGGAREGVLKRSWAMQQFRRRIQVVGTSSSPLCEASQENQPRLIVTGSHASSHLDVWQLDTETSDVIKKLHTVPGQGTEGGGIRSVAQRPGHRGQVAFGAMMSNLQVADVETKEVIATDFGKVEGGLEMQFLNNNELVTCSTQNGLVNIHDLRTTSSQSVLTDQSMKLSSAESKHCSLDEGTTQTYNKTISQSGSGLDVAVDESTNQNISKKGKASWTFDLSCSPVPHLDPAGGEIACKRPKLDVSMAMVVSLCSSGELVIRDLRNLEMPLQHVQLGDEKRQPREMETLTVRWCPTEKNLLSVSGLNGCVDIYDISTWQQSSTSPPNVQPIFSHEGHMTGESANQGGGILCHAWHPRHPCVVMSSGSNGSLHAWDWSAVL
ncbi:WD repeat-containing protein 73-like isoform X2 [Acanthaster planci]|uniref:WD repeat-containing protein 73-like isoform X2 n=1 Tax=Acanthaster planci TaxID=133434 RepID=A0A8B7Y6T0_ACAPL|nr:WD repeat-containing protein 73-like isoform X2 [Acanthaster planci]